VCGAVLGMKIFSTKYEWENHGVERERIPKPTVNKTVVMK
jgi:hypothetical protein